MQHKVVVMKGHGVFILHPNDDCLGEILGGNGIDAVGGCLFSVGVKLDIIGRLQRLGTTEKSVGSDPSCRLEE